MKAIVASFGLDTARLLASTNQDAMNSEYGKMLIRFDNKYNELSQDIVKQSDVRKKMDDINQQIKDINSLNQGMVDRAMSKEVQKDLDDALQDIPSSTTYYRNIGDFPSDPSPGDMVWQSPDWKDANANHMRAKLYEYYKDSGWRYLKDVDPNLYGVNINGASIKGGMITGGTFRSNQQGALGSLFQIDQNGKIYAQDLQLDLEHAESPTGEINPCAYLATHLNRNGDEQSGLNFHNGMMRLFAPVYQRDGTFVGQGGNKYIGWTYAEPDYFKLRTYAMAEEGSHPNTSYYGVKDPDYDPHADTSQGVKHDGLIGRTDVRGGNIEVSNQWSQWTGVRIGYWQTDPDDPQSDARIAITSKNGNTLELTGDGIKLNGKPCGCFDKDDKNDDNTNKKTRPILFSFECLDDEQRNVDKVIRAPLGSKVPVPTSIIPKGYRMLTASEIPKLPQGYSYYYKDAIPKNYYEPQENKLVIVRPLLTNGKTVTFNVWFFDKDENLIGKRQIQTLLGLSYDVHRAGVPKGYHISNDKSEFVYDDSGHNRINKDGVTTPPNNDYIVSVTVEKNK